MTEKNDLAKRVLTLKRTFNAPIQLVWEAWTRPEHIAQWWGPKGMEIQVIEHNFKVGGKWKYAMQMRDGSAFTSDGVYSEIVEREKIVSSANFKPMTEGVEIRALFEENGDKTNFTFSVVHPTEEYRIQQEKMGFYNGWGSVFERLEGYLNSLKKKTVSPKTNKIIYWSATGLLSVIVLMYVGNSIFNHELFSKRFAELGYPLYLIYPLTIAKILALIAIWSDQSKTLKEWAYAGLTFDFVLAIMAEARAHDGDYFSPPLALILLFASYLFWKKQ